MVAIKIIQRFSKKRRLGKLTYDPESKTKKEVAILKKVRHANVVALLEVIDDPELKKIYLVLEHVELGEIVWRKKGHGQVCLFERRRLEKEMAGEPSTEEVERFFVGQERRRKRKEAQRVKGNQQSQPQNWSLEHNQDTDDQEGEPLTRHNTHNSSQRSLAGSYPSFAARSTPVSRAHSRATSRAPSGQNSRSHTPLPEYDIPPLDSDNEDDMPALPQSWSSHIGAHSMAGRSSAIDGSHSSSGQFGSGQFGSGQFGSGHFGSGQFGSGQFGLGQYFGSHQEDAPFRGRSPSMADSIISHMSSVGDYPNDTLEEDYSYVPCLTLEGARSIFRDTVLGLEYLHYEGIVHRDIKPANLLWTKDHRTKISDFGVSYFGRPIREGESEEYVSEADAVDFDDDRELAKTVGTPAFFAPELCYTDLEAPAPKVTEQIDVWSLGVTLYALIYARLPFMSDDEYSLWNMISKDDVFISKKRLMAVGPPSGTGTDPYQSYGPCREEGELAFEDVDDELADLLRRMLIKDPADRIKLREVKRHPWVIKGIENVLGWIDDTDPSRKTSGKRIIVDKAELDHAVVPISILDRARSVFIKTVNSIGGSMRRPKSDNGSRRRAASSVNSSENMNSPITPIIRDSLSRRASLRGDEALFGSSSDLSGHRITTEHPLANSQTASPALSSSAEFLLDAVPQLPSVGVTPKRVYHSNEPAFDSRPGPPERATSAATSIQTVVYRGHSYNRSVTSTPGNDDAPTLPGPFTDHHGNIFGGYLWRGSQHMADIQETSPSQPKAVDYGVFSSENKRSEPSVALSNTVVPGHVENSPPSPAHQPRTSYPSDINPITYNIEQPLASPHFFQPHMISQLLAGKSNSTSNVPQVSSMIPHQDERPATASRTPEATRQAKQDFTEDTFEDDVKSRRRATSNLRMRLHTPPPPTTNTIHSPHNIGHSHNPDHSTRAQSSSSINSTEIISQLTSPSDIVSPISSVTVSSQEQIFRSAPSLPGLVSSGSSVCADPEGDFLQHPGIVSPQSGFSHPDSTPETLSPVLTKNDGETPTQTIDEAFGSTLPVDDDGYNGEDDTTLTLDDDDSSDSDDGLVLMMGKKRKMPSRQMTVERRGTDNSVGSTETAKKVIMEK